MARHDFRPWVRKAGGSILIVATAVSVALLLFLLLSESGTRSWLGEPFVWLYIGALWVGGAKIWFGTRRPVVETDDEGITLRPLHLIRSRRILWDELIGSEQMIGGDRLILCWRSSHGPRQVALNLNLVRRRRQFLEGLEERLSRSGFQERIIERSRYLWRDSDGRPDFPRPG